MKKFLSLIMLVAVISATAFATDGGKVNRAVEQAFSKTFAGAQFVSWKVIKDQNIHQAAFMFHNQRLQAFFDGEGNLIGTGRAIEPTNLPLMVSRSLSARYPGNTISEVVEYVQNEETSYIVTVMTEKAKLIVRANPIGTTYVFKKEKL